MQSRQPVDRAAIIRRGLANQCPNCGSGRLFEGLLRLRQACPDCGLSLDRGEGFYLGSMSINYGVTLLFFHTPVLILWILGILGGLTAAILAGVGALIVPALLYRSSRSWWLTIYYCVLPHELPANETEAVPVDRERE